MNRGLWLVCSLSLGTAAAASGCYVGTQPPPPAYVTRPRRPNPSRATARSTRRRHLPTRSLSISPLRPVPATPGSTGTGTGPALNGPGTPATGRQRTRPTCSSARASCSSTAGPSTTAPTGRGRAAIGPTATDTAVAPRWAHGARGPLWRQAPGAPSTTKDGGALQARRPGAAHRRGGRSPCGRAIRDSAGGQRRRLGRERPPFTRRPHRPFTRHPRRARRPRTAAVAAAASTTEDTRSVLARARCSLGRLRAARGRPCRFAHRCLSATAS